MTFLALTTLALAAPNAVMGAGTVLTTEPHKALQVMLTADTRECAPPQCGGWFYVDLNHPLTVCPDGTRRASCYVYELDFGPMGLRDDQIDRILDATEELPVMFDVQVVTVDALGLVGGLVIFDVDLRMPVQ